MKLISSALAAMALLALTACAPQGRTVGFPTKVYSNERLSVAADGELRVGFYVGLVRDDCSTTGKATVRASLDPAHGRLDMRQAQDVPRIIGPQGSARARCAGRSQPGTLVTYRPAPGFTGDDAFGIDVIWPSGVSMQRTISVQVR
jgi:hypothetical protein